jgi:hypothetical protein
MQEQKDKERPDPTAPFRREEGGSFVYNLTIKVEASIASLWLEWLINEHVPDVLQTKCFTGHTILHLLDVDDSEGPTYAIQYHAASKSDYNRYIELHAPEMRRRSFEKWGDRFIAFRTLMEVVQ